MKKSFLLIAILVLLAIFSNPTSAGLLGGFSGVHNADGEINHVLSRAHNSVLKSGSLSSTARLIPLSYRTQVVAGTNFLVKVKVEDGNNVSYANVKIYRPLPPHHEEYEILSFSPSTATAPLS